MAKVAFIVVCFLSMHVPMSVAKASQGPFKIGLILDMHGANSAVAGEGSVVAARMAAEDFGGSILGRPIEIVAADHQNKPDLAAQTARKWFDEEDVQAIMDVASFAPALAVDEIAKARKKIIIFNTPSQRRLTNIACGPYSIHYAYDSYAVARALILASANENRYSWYFITANYPVGLELEDDAIAILKNNRGELAGSVRSPVKASDFSPFFAKAQASKASVVGLANDGADTIAAIKQARELQFSKSGKKLAALLASIMEIDGAGLDAAQGLLLSQAFYWDQSDEASAWSLRFYERVKRMPTDSQAGVYSATLHYLKSVAAARTAKSDVVMKRIRSLPINDFFAKNGRIREDGRMVHDMYVFEVKSPEESGVRWDYLKTLATISGEQAFQPLSTSKCRLLNKEQGQ